ncbi:PadR family transcriptional regulator [Roseisolibacter agri]|uniref:PadR family transcriptional regulator n=1 Tax=Roseisolibacter agri TaxID=2014610 RepID=A0AA37V2F0_9BACT|nr:PadR family transcriptional regulator [Roseisolibacter agri]GLC25182.1 PadR family transcriptional regulator [Roseisolibacter agri]
MAESELNVLRSSLDLVILKALTWGPRHGYAVAEWVEQATADVLLLEEGTLYPALHRLERHGWVSAEWGVSDNNRRAKFYALTTAGRAQLRRETPTWLRHAEAIARALRAQSPEVA